MRQLEMCDLGREFDAIPFYVEGDFAVDVGAEMAAFYTLAHVSRIMVD
jgi:hypothetical protein